MPFKDWRYVDFHYAPSSFLNVFFSLIPQFDDVLVTRGLQEIKLVFFEWLAKLKVLRNVLFVLCCSFFEMMFL